MINAYRWVFLIPIVFIAAMIPFILASRDPVDEARRQLAAMTPAQRKAIEQSREAYGKLSSLDQYELRQFSGDLAKLDAKDRAELEAVMGRLQAWVATFPDDVRAKYFAEMTSGRIAILKSQLGRWKDEEKKIVAQAGKAEEESRKGIAGGSSERRELPRTRIEDRVNGRGSPDERAALTLAKSQQRLSPMDVGLIYACLAGPAGLKASAKQPGKAQGKGQKRDILAELSASGTFAHFTYIAPFRRLVDERFQSESWRFDLAKALIDVYLLAPPSKALEEVELRRRLDLGSNMPNFQPTYLLQQLAMLKDYSEGKAKPPLKDLARVKFLLGKSP
jgi:hypothetical protein